MFRKNLVTKQLMGPIHHHHHRVGRGEGGRGWFSVRFCFKICFKKYEQNIYFFLFKNQQSVISL